MNDDIVDLFIGAAMVNPQGAEKANKWISLVNLSGEPIDINDWKLKDKKAELLLGKANLGNNTSLQSGESRVIKPVIPLMLSNSGDVIQLWDNNGKRIDWVNYTSRMVSEGKPTLFLSPRETLK